MIYAYCRVSTKHQELERQIINVVKAYPEIKIISEKFTGTTTDRPEWSKLKAAVREGDTIVFDSVSRMSRNAEEGFRDYTALFDGNINLVFLKEPHINTDTYKQALERQIDSVIDTGDKSTDKFINAIMDAIKQYQLDLAEKQIQLAFEQSEKEVTDNHSRVKEGMAASGAGRKISKARTGSKYETKKAKDAKETILRLGKGFLGKLTDAEMMKQTGITHNSLYKYKTELRAETTTETIEKHSKTFGGTLTDAELSELLHISNAEVVTIKREIEQKQLTA